MTPLGVAFAIAAGWAECHFFGEKQLCGAQDPLGGGQDATPMLVEQAASQGLPPSSWHVPVFCCDEQQGPHAMPVFLSRKALAAAWLVAGGHAGWRTCRATLQ